MNTGYNVYRIYLSMKTHFTSKSFNMFKHGKTRSTREAYEKRKDKYLFEKLSNKYSNKDIVKFFLANFTSGNKTGGLYKLKEESFDNFVQWKARIESIDHIFDNNLRFLLKKNGYRVETSFIIDEHNTYPPILKFYFSGKVSLETLVILNDLYSILDKLDSQIVGDVHYDWLSNLIRKYRDFLSVDLDKFKEIILKATSEMEGLN